MFDLCAYTGSPELSGAARASPVAARVHARGVTRFCALWCGSFCRERARTCEPVARHASRLQHCSLLGQKPASRNLHSNCVLLYSHLGTPYAKTDLSLQGTRNVRNTEPRNVTGTFRTARCGAFSRPCVTALRTPHWMEPIWNSALPICPDPELCTSTVASSTVASAV